MKVQYIAACKCGTWTSIVLDPKEAPTRYVKKCKSCGKKFYAIEFVGIQFNEDKKEESEN